MLLIHGTAGEGLFVVVDESDEAHPPGSTEAVVATLLWAGGELPSMESMRTLPLLLDDEGGARSPQMILHILFSPTRGKQAFNNFGEVVHKGLLRPDAADFRNGDRPDGPRVGWATWTFLAKWVGGEWFQRCVELTRRVHGLE